MKTIYIKGNNDFVIERNTRRIYAGPDQASIFSKPIKVSENGFNLVPLFDIHAGNPYFDKGLFERACEVVLKTPNTYAVAGGDLIENIIRNSKGCLLSQTMHPDSQIDYVVGVLEPLAKKNKILVSIGGNHENRTGNETFHNTSLEICKYLKIPYGGHACSIPFRIHNHMDFWTYITHGASGASSVGGRMNAMKKLTRFATTARLCIMGHIHSGSVPDPELIFDVTRSGKRIVLKKYFVGGGSCLAPFGYAEKALYDPIAPSLKIIRIDPVIVKDERGRFLYRDLEMKVSDI